MVHQTPLDCCWMLLEKFYSYITRCDRLNCNNVSLCYRVNLDGYWFGMDASFDIHYTTSDRLPIPKTVYNTEGCTTALLLSREKPILLMPICGLVLKVIFILKKKKDVSKRKYH